jgi:hypothetical protein
LPKKPQLSVVNLVRTVPAPPPELGEYGRSLWTAVLQQYDIVDAGGLETLRQACCASDRAESCRKIIAEDGEMLRTKTGVRSHPLLRDELQNRSLTLKAIQRLGLDLEPIKSIGRPPGVA